jgi:hypothetical protein
MLIPALIIGSRKLQEMLKMLFFWLPNSALRASFRTVGHTHTQIPAVLRSISHPSFASAVAR